MAKDDGDASEGMVFVCEHVFRDASPVLLVVRDEDGDWQFLCGQGHEPDEVPRVVGIDQLWELDSRLRELRDLPDRFEAERGSVAGAWIRTPIATTLN